MTKKANRRRSTFKSERRAELSKPRTRLLTTSQLIQFARRRRTTFEAYLVLSGGLRATHWLTYVGKGNFIAEGIDSEDYETTADEFTETYAWVGERAVWHVDHA